MHPNVHCSTVCKSQNTEATKLSTDRGMGKEDVVPIYNGILVIIKNEIRPPAATWMHLETVILSMPEKNIM